MKTNPLVLPHPATAAPSGAGGLRDIKPPVEIPNPWTWIWWVLAALALAALAYALWRFLKKRRERPVPPPPPVPAHVRARGQLRRALELLERPKPFCTLVADTIRVYLEECFELRAPERTTEEFLEELEYSSRLTPPQKKTLHEFLTQCDLVKFARHEPPVFELESLYREAERLIDETTPSPVESDPQTAPPQGSPPTEPSSPQPTLASP